MRPAIRPRMRVPAILVAAALAACSGTRGSDLPDIGHGRVGVTVLAPVVRYPVTAATLAEIQSEIRQSGPRVDGQRWAGSTRWSMRWNYRAEPGAASRCALQDVRIELKAEITMPEWKPEVEADDATKLWWRRFERGLLEHEAGHARLAVSSANTLRDAFLRLRAPQCNQLLRDAESVGRLHLEQLRASQAAYDAETRHGGTQITASLQADAP